MKTAIVTGANGYIGRMLVGKLLNKEASVTAIDLPGTSCVHATQKNVAFIEADLVGMSQLLNDVPADVDVLYHLAWSGVHADLRANYHLQAQNISMSLNMMELAYKKGIKKVVMLGSASEYIGGADAITGYNIPSPIEAYGAAKCAAHIMCETFATENDVALVWATVTSIYGPGRDDNNILSYAIKTLLKGDKPTFTLLEQIWDYLYIEDFMNALYLIGEYGRAGTNYPVASGNARPLKEFIEIIRDSIDPDLPLGIGEKPYKSGKAEHSIFIIDKLISDTGFTPDITFEHGIEKVIKYFKEQAGSDVNV